MLNKPIVRNSLSLFCLRHGFQRPARFISDNECGYVPVPEQLRELAMTENFERSFAEHAEQLLRHEKACNQASAQNRRIIFEALSVSRITAVTVSFDGEGDSGQIEEIAVVPEGEDTLLDVLVDAVTARWTDCEIVSERTPLRDVIEQVCYAALAETNGGWENNEGAFGDFRFDVANRTLTLEFNGRYMSTEYSEHSWTEEA